MPEQEKEEEEEKKRLLSCLFSILTHLAKLPRPCNTGSSVRSVRSESDGGGEGKQVRLKHHQSHAGGVVKIISC